MTREGIQQCDENFLRNVTLPAKTDTYTVISHGYIIDKVRTTLAQNNLEIEAEEYLYSYTGNVVLAKVKIKSAKDSDLGMIFTWWNSYNKMVKFGCAIGGFIYDNNTSLIGSEGMSWIRKHTGTADTESSNILEQLISQADIFFDKIIAEKERMKAMPLSVDMFGCIMGALYFELDLISPNQASVVKQEYKKPQNEYKDKDTLWGLYKLLMFGINGMDLRKWAVCQQKLHYTIMNTYAIAVETTQEQPTFVEQLEVEMIKQAQDVPPTATMLETTEEIVEEYNGAKEDVVYVLINEHGKDPAIVNYFCDNYFKSSLTLTENVNAFFDYIKPIKANVTAEEIVAPVEILTPEVAKEKSEAAQQEVTIEDLVVETEPTSTDDFVFPDDLDNPEKLAKDNQESIKALETLATETTSNVVPEGFEWLLEDDITESPEMELTEGLEIPSKVIELASKIEDKMKSLYGAVKPYNYNETNKYYIVTLDNTNEVFCLEH
jgi:hypothetical protein